MSEPKGPLSAIAQPIGEEIARHLNAPPLRQNQDRVVWGTAILTFGSYVANAFLWIKHIDFWRGVPAYFHALHAPWDTSWPYYLWGGAMLFGLLWLVVGLRGARGPRQIMTGFWGIAWAVFGGVALWSGWYVDDWPALDWFLKGIYLCFVTCGLMLSWLALRGTGPGAIRLIQRQIAARAKVFRVGRRRTF